MAQGFKMRKLLHEYKTIFLAKRRKRWISSKTFSLYLSFLWNSFEACQKPKSNLLRSKIMAQGFKTQILVDEYKTNFLGKRDKHWNFFKTFSLYLSFLINGFEACQNPTTNLIRLKIMAQGFKMQKLVDEYKRIFLGKPGKRWKSSKTFSLYLSFL